MNKIAIKPEEKNLNYGGKKIGKEIETLENTLHGAKSELQGQTEEANRVNGSGTDQGRLCGVKATNVELKLWMCGDT